MEEIWKDIPNYEGLYQASTLGRIKSFKKGKGAVINGTVSNRGYVMVKLNGENKSVHQLVAMTFLNHIPCGFKLVINHINFIKTDNRLENLEVVTNRQNCNKKHLKSADKYTGVSFDKRYGKWVAHITINNEPKYLGTFDSAEEASRYYEDAVVAVEKEQEVKVKIREVSSKYRCVGWNKHAKKWNSKITADGIRINLGYFDDELEASQYYENALIAIKNGTEIQIKRVITSSRYKGVCWKKGSNKWQARIKIGEDRKYLGLFDTEIEAHKAVENALNNRLVCQ